MEKNTELASLQAEEKNEVPNLPQENIASVASPKEVSSIPLPNIPVVGQPPSIAKADISVPNVTPIGNDSSGLVRPQVPQASVQVTPQVASPTPISMPPPAIPSFDGMQNM